MTVARCGSRSGVEAAAVTPTIVKTQLDELETILVEEGIAAGSPPIITKPNLVFAADEKRRPIEF